MARYYSASEQVDAVIRMDGKGTSETLTNLTVTEQEYYVDVQLSSTILEEGETYTIDITSGGNLLFRGKIFVTSQNDYTIKHELAQPSYSEYNETDDNTYIIR